MYLQYAGKLDALASRREPSYSRMKQLWKNISLVRFLEDIKSHPEEGECDKISLTPCKAPPKVSSTPINKQPLHL